MGGKLVTCEAKGDRDTSTVPTSSCSSKLFYTHYLKGQQQFIGKPAALQI